MSGTPFSNVNKHTVNDPWGPEKYDYTMMKSSMFLFSCSYIFRRWMFWNRPFALLYSKNENKSWPRGLPSYIHMRRWRLAFVCLSLTSLSQYGSALWLNLLVGKYFSACLNADINISFTKSGSHVQLSIDNTGMHFKLLVTEYWYC